MPDSLACLHASAQGVELSGAKLDVRTGRGALKLRRLVGKDVYVELHNAPMAVGALYAENTRVHTGVLHKGLGRVWGDLGTGWGRRQGSQVVWRCTV